jgi:hypothetical protein
MNVLIENAMNQIDATKVEEMQENSAAVCAKSLDAAWPMTC